MAEENEVAEAVEAAATEIVAEVNRRVALVAADVFAADDLTPEWIDIPQWDGGLFVRPMTGLERDTYEQSLVKGKGPNREFNIANARAKLVVLVAVDENDKPIFTKGDVKRLGEKSSAALNLIFELATKQSGMSEADIEELTEDFVDDPS